MKILVVAVALAVPVLACSTSSHESSGGVVCPAGVPGIMVEVRDAATGAPAACGAQGWAQQIRSTRVELLDETDDCTAHPDGLYLQGVGRAGLYLVSIRKSGYW